MKITAVWASGRAMCNVCGELIEKHDSQIVITGRQESCRVHQVCLMNMKPEEREEEGKSNETR